MSQVNNPTGLQKLRPVNWTQNQSQFNYLRQIEEVLRQVYENLTGVTRLRTYTVANLPDPADYQPDSGGAALIYVSDETGGAVTAFSDGTDWRRTTDRAVVS